MKAPIKVGNVIIDLSKVCSVNKLYVNGVFESLYFAFDTKADRQHYEKIYCREFSELPKDPTTEELNSIFDSLLNKIPE